MNLLQRAALAASIYTTVFERAESFEEQNIGADLAYLMGAILTEKHVEFGVTRPLMLILVNEYPPEHSVWTYVRLVGFHTDGEIPTKEDMAKDVPIGAKPDRIAMLLGASHYRRVR